MIVKVADIQPNTMAIYKINYLNGKIYIGQSSDLKRRMQEHNAPISSKKKRQACDYAIASQGQKITEIEILEYIEKVEDLEPREAYWIKFCNAHNRLIGYNLTDGGDGSGKCCEDSPVSTFTNEEVLDIRKRRYNGERKKDVYKDYSNKSFGTFERIWLGRGYPTIGQEYIILPHTKTRQEYSSEANAGVKNGRAKCNEEQVREIRQRYDNGEMPASIAKDFPFLTKNSIARIARRETYANIK